MLETIRLYYEDVYQKTFQAKVLDCRKRKDGYCILLDQSAFYPEGGGQPSDQGVFLVDGTDTKLLVREVHEKDGELLHYTEAPLACGTIITGVINWERRFDLMQQHSGEHMVSGLIHEAYGYDNVGFHMGSDVITIDFNGEITALQLAEIESRVNDKIWENEEIEITYPSAEVLSRLPYRSKKELTGKVRIVRFPGVDLCACCGTHVGHTGEIGMVKILSVIKFREGVRVEMICGKRVLAYLNVIEEQNHQISVKLSAKPEKTAPAVERLVQENYHLKGRIAALEAEVFEMESAKWEDAGDVLLFQEALDPDAIRKLTDLVMNRCKGRCAVFSRCEDGSYKYAIGEAGGDLREFTKNMNAALKGRGGGKPFFVQGSVSASEEEIKAYFER